MGSVFSLGLSVDSFSTVAEFGAKRGPHAIQPLDAAVKRYRRGRMDAEQLHGLLSEAFGDQVWWL